MATVSTQPPVGSLLREWRERRRLTQLELALDAGISTRHLSFVETGRSKPGREMLLRVARAARAPVPGAEPAAARRGSRPGLPRALARRPRAGAGARGARSDPGGPRALPADRRGPRMEHRGRQLHRPGADRGRRDRPGAARASGQRGAGQPAPSGARAVDRRTSTDGARSSGSGSSGSVRVTGDDDADAADRRGRGLPGSAPVRSEPVPGRRTLGTAQAARARWRASCPSSACSPPSTPRSR